MAQDLELAVYELFFNKEELLPLWSLPENAEIDDELHARLHDAYALAYEGEPR